MTATPLASFIFLSTTNHGPTTTTAPVPRSRAEQRASTPTPRRAHPTGAAPSRAPPSVSICVDRAFASPLTQTDRSTLPTTIHDTFYASSTGTRRRSPSCSSSSSGTICGSMVRDDAHSRPAALIPTDASLSEYFYQLRLVPDHTPTPRLGAVYQTSTPRLSNRQRWGMLLVLVGLPYLRARMDDAYDRWSTQNDPELSLADQGAPLNPVSFPLHTKLTIGSTHLRQCVPVDLDWLRSHAPRVRLCVPLREDPLLPTMVPVVRDPRRAAPGRRGPERRAVAYR